MGYTVYSRCAWESNKRKLLTFSIISQHMSCRVHLTQSEFSVDELLLSSCSEKDVSPARLNSNSSWQKCFQFRFKRTPHANADNQKIMRRTDSNGVWCHVLIPTPLYHSLLLFLPLFLSFFSFLSLFFPSARAWVCCQLEDWAVTGYEKQPV